MKGIRDMKCDESDRKASKLLSLLSNQTCAFPGKDFCFILIEAPEQLFRGTYHTSVYNAAEMMEIITVMCVVI